MSDQSNLGIFDLTKPVPLLHPSLFDARAFGPKGKERGEPKFSAGFLFDPDSEDLKAIKVKAVAVARAKWPGVDLKTLKWPWESGDKRADARIAALAKKAGIPVAQFDVEKSDGEFQRGKIVVTARSKFQPRLAGVVNGKIVDFEDDASKTRAKPTFYFGADSFAQFNLVAYDKIQADARDGVTAYLNMVLSLNQGTRLSKTQSAAETFKGYLGAYSNEDPIGDESGLDDDIPF